MKEVEAARVRLAAVALQKARSRGFLFGQNGPRVYKEPEGATTTTTTRKRARGNEERAREERQREGEGERERGEFSLLWLLKEGEYQRVKKGGKGARGLTEGATERKNGSGPLFNPTCVSPRVAMATLWCSL